MIEGRKTMQSYVDQALAVAAGKNMADSDNYVGRSILNEISSLAWAERARDLIPPYWSKGRDAALREFWKQPGAGHLSSAIYNAQSKLIGIPFKVVPRDSTIVSHVEQAEKIQYRLTIASEFAGGFERAMAKWFEDYLSQDNGAFLEVLGAGPLDGPIKGAPIAVRHLDSARCVRTGDPIYPVIYQDDQDYKLHFSRVIFSSQMPSAIKELNGVGYCAVSRAIDVAQTLIDMNVYKREKLGSRPHSRLFIGQGISASDIMAAFRMADTAMDQRGLKRYSRNVAIGSEDSSDIDIKTVDLTSMDQFDESKSIPLAMMAIAMAFGMDVTELWPSVGAGGKSASISSLNARGKLPKQVTSVLEREFNFKFLPPHLMFVYDFQDDDEDQQRAVIRDIRARSRERNLYGKVTVAQAERRIMLKDGDIDRVDFMQMEMLDGRLEDGAPVESLFYSADLFYTGDNGVLNTGLANPFVVSDNDPEVVMAIIQSLRQKCYAAIGGTSGGKVMMKARYALVALDKLEEVYMTTPEDPVLVSQYDDDRAVERMEEDIVEDEVPDTELGPRFRQRTDDREGGNTNGNG